MRRGPLAVRPAAGYPLLVVVLGWVASAVSAPGLDQSRAEQQELKQRIVQLQRELAQSEKDRSETDAALRAAAQGLSAQARELESIRRKRDETKRQIARAESDADLLKVRIEDRRGLLAEWLRRHYRQDRPSKIADFLGSRDTARVARDAYYLQKIGQANMEILQAQRYDLQRLSAKREEVERRRAELLELERAGDSRQRSLAAKRAALRGELAAIDSRIHEQRGRIGNLREAEERLGKLIEGLQTLARERAARNSAPTSRERVEPSTRRDGQSRREQVVASVDAVSSRNQSSAPFASLKGRLDAPIRGDVVGRFGMPRADGGPAWKGVFIRADEGAEVRAIASGEVVFADWMRGFGNLVIVDHGDEYLSVYGNSETLFAEVGQRVRGGDIIASVGVGGSSDESGLYFEIRFRGEPVDPLRWVRARSDR